MAQEIKPRLVRIDDFVADHLEAVAKRCHPGQDFKLASGAMLRRTYGHLRAPRRSGSGKNQKRSQSLPLCVDEWGQSKFPVALASDELSLYRVIS